MYRTGCGTTRGAVGARNVCDRPYLERDAVRLGWGKPGRPKGRPGSSS
jgi:hypothetical protein